MDGEVRTVKALFDSYGITAGNVYEVFFVYDTVFEIFCDTGRLLCVPKGFFEPAGYWNGAEWGW